MKKTAFIAVLALAITTGSSLAYAEQPPAHPSFPGGMHGMASSSDMRMMGRMGSSTAWGMGHMASGSPMRMGGVASSSDHMMMSHGIPGVVAEVDASSFLLAVHGKDGAATTTLTVNVTDATQYHQASTTVAFSDIVVGAHVEVLGKVATSTKTVAAEDVRIGGDGRLMKAVESHPGFFARIKAFFTGRHATSTEMSGGPAAAAESDGVLGGIAHTLFGWL